MPIATTTTTPVNANKCRGYILAHQHPDAPPVTPEHPIDPYDVVPCPHPTCIPAVPSERCADPTRRNGCGRGVYCAMHFCGSCKKALRAAEGAKSLKMVGVGVGGAHMAPATPEAATAAASETTTAQVVTQGV